MIRYDNSTILIVDDSSMNRALLLRIFQDMFNTIEADNGLSALNAMRENEVSAVLLDLAMPVMDGYAVLQAMREDRELSDIPVIVVTGSEDSDSQVRALNLGAVDFILKPFNPHVVRARVRNTIEWRLNQKLAAESTMLRQRVAHQEDIIRLSEYDRLTGLLNRETFSVRASNMISEKGAGYYVISLFDIDNFKVINDQYGQDVGDRVLIEVAKLVTAFVGKEGVSARISSDLYVMMFPANVNVGMAQMTEDLERAFAKEGKRLNITFTAGRYVVDDLNLSVPAMIDRAMLAKRSVKGIYNKNLCYYTEEMRDKLIEEQWLIGEMENALNLHQFEAWFQPQYNHVTGRLSGAEALVRWRHPDRGLISPAKFVPLFERNGFIYELDKAVMELTCLQIRRLLDMGVGVPPISANLSRYDIFRPDIVEVITGLVEKYNIPKNLFRLEITESAFVRDVEKLIQVVDKLRDYGLFIEIDDFGSGYSSFNTLKDVPADVIKIDMRFLSGKENTERGGCILDSIARMARWLGMGLIAEGVETGEQADFLRTIGCYDIQGNFYARPMPASEFEQLVIQRGAEDERAKLETNKHLNVETFWSPQSIETMVFNRFSGGACVFEYSRDKTEVLRINEKFASAFGNGLTEANVLRADLFSLFDTDSSDKLRIAIQSAVDTGEEQRIDARYDGSVDGGSEEYLRFTISIIARSGEWNLLYGYIDNITSEIRAVERDADQRMRLKYLSDAAAKLLSDSDCEKAITEMLENLRTHFNAASVFITEKADNGELRTTYSASVNPPKDDIFVLPKELTDVIFNIADGESFIHIHDCSVQENIGAVGVKICEEYKISSITSVSLNRENRVIGYLSVINAGGRAAKVDYISPISDYVTVMLARRDYENQFKKDASELRGLMDNLPCVVGIYDVSHDSIVRVTVNREYENMFGVSVPSNSEVSDAVHPDDLAALYEYADLVVQGKRDLLYDIRVRKGDGAYRAVRLYGRIISCEGKVATMYVIVMPRDVNIALNGLMPAVFKSIMDSSKSIEFVKDANLKYVCCTNAFAEYVGIGDALAARGKSDFELFPPSIAREYYEEDALVLRSGEPMIEKRENMLSPNGVMRYITTSKYQIYDDTGDIIGIYGVCRDEPAPSIAGAGNILAKLCQRFVSMSVCDIDSDRVYPIKLSGNGFTSSPDKAYQWSKLIDGEISGIAKPEYAEALRGASDPSILMTAFETDDSNKVTVCQLKNGKWMRVCVQPVKYESGVTKSVLVTVTDVTEEFESRRRLNESTAKESTRAQRYARLLIDAANGLYTDIIRIDMTSDEVSYISIVNSRISEKEEPGGFKSLYKRFTDSILEDDRAEVIRLLRGGDLSAVAAIGAITLTYRRVTANGEPRWQTTIVRASGGRMITMFTADIHDDMVERARLIEASERDGLTGLFNRRKLSDMIRGDYSKLKSCGALFFDVNGLKKANDRMGHDVGDELLCKIADSIRMLSSENIHAYRYGGDEFLLIACDVTEDELDVIMDRWKSDLPLYEIMNDPAEPAAVGKAWGKAPVSVNELIRLADLSMYKNKRRFKESGQ